MQQIWVVTLICAAVIANAARTRVINGGARSTAFVEEFSKLGEAVDGAAVVAARFAADAEVGSGLGVVAKGGPATLEEYCKGGGGSQVEEGAKVEADWRGMGTNYPGVVKDENRDGTVDILYDDGFVEKRVKMKRVVPTETKETADDPANDPACQLSDFVGQVKKMVDEAYANIAAWLAHAKMKQEGRAPPTFKPPATTAAPVAAPAAAPAAGPAATTTLPTNDELEQLKKILAERDNEVANLRNKVGDNDVEILDRMGLPTGSTSGGLLTVDDLIKEYTAKIAKRDQEIKELKQRLEEQQEQLVAMGARVVDLEAINQQVLNISALCDGARVKRDNLLKAGKLDDELAISLESIFKTEEKLTAKIGTLMGMDRAAKKAAAERKARGETGEDDEADKEMLKAAMEVEKDLKGVQESTKKLDEGVHPHGDKWWRYRYERSFVEAILMVMVSIFMLLWERGYRYLRKAMYKKSHAAIEDHMTHGTMYINWLEYFAGELMVCLLAFLCVWILAKVDAFDYLPLILKKSEKLHLPHSGAEYRRIAIDIAVVSFFAVIFYYCLILSVVHHTTKKLNEWAKADVKHEALAKAGMVIRGAPAPGAARAAADMSSHMPLQRRNSTMVANEYESLRSYFALNVKGDPELLECIKAESGKPFDDATFPFWVYLRLNVRHTVDQLFMFGWIVWILIIVSFIGFACFHRWAAMGYIRIMGIYGVALVILFAAMFVWCKHVNQLVIQHCDDEDFDPNHHTPQLFRDYWIEGIVMKMIHYVLFFLCYGASRMICQPWMWELHFWPVLCLTILTVIISILFVFVFSPIIPLFAAVTALPPFVDPDNIKLLHDTIAVSGASADKFAHSSP